MNSNNTVLNRSKKDWWLKYGEGEKAPSALQMHALFFYLLV